MALGGGLEQRSFALLQTTRKQQQFERASLHNTTNLVGVVEFGTLLQKNLDN